MRDSMVVATSARVQYLHHSIPRLAKKSVPKAMEADLTVPGGTLDTLRAAAVAAVAIPPAMNAQATETSR
jgi:hypothetical protein